MTINVKGVLISCQEALRAMHKAPRLPGTPRQKIVVISSATAHNPKIGLGAHAVSKIALVNLVRVLASEQASRGINVNAVAPGTIRTLMVLACLEGAQDNSGFKLYGTAPVGRLGQPEDVANAIKFLCSDEADFITGAIIPIDGGTTAPFSVN
jgi:NAD(P)-dependent dehydrogenase (short-subunit alcohol dehydrogenase family)